MNDRLEELREEIKQAQSRQTGPDTGCNSPRLPQYEMSPKLLVLKEFIIHIAAGGFISYVLGTVFSMARDNKGIPMVTAIVMLTALLAASYRSWRILKGKNPDG